MCLVQGVVYGGRVRERGVHVDVSVRMCVGGEGEGMVWSGLQPDEA